MTLTMSQILNLPNFYDYIKGSKLPMRTVYKLSQLKKELDFHITFYNENFQALVLEYGALDENGVPQFTEDGAGIKIRPDVAEECSQKINELLNLQIEIPEFQFALEDFDGIQLTLDILEPMLPFIKE